MHPHPGDSYKLLCSYPVIFLCEERGSRRCVLGSCLLLGKSVFLFSVWGTPPFLFQLYLIGPQKAFIATIPAGSKSNLSSLLLIQIKPHN